MAAESQAIQNIINKIIELRAQIKEAELAKEQLDHRMAEALVAGADPAGGMFQQMKKSFFDPAEREIEELKKQLKGLQQDYTAAQTGRQLALPANASGGDGVSYEEMARRREALPRESMEKALEDKMFPDIPRNYISRWNEIGKAIPKATASLREFLSTQTSGRGRAVVSTIDTSREGYTKLSGSIKHATGVQEQFNYTIDEKTGLRTYAGTLQHTSGLMEKFSKTVDATGKEVSTLNKDGFNPATFGDYGKQADKLLGTIGRLGFTTADLKDVQEEASTGIRRYTLAARDQEGVMRRATITTDKWGNILQDTQKRFRGFFSTLTRNTKEVLKWTIAVQLTYKPLMKMYELVEVMIDNEAKLADITIALGESYESLNDIFRIAADVAQDTGSSIKGVLEGYELAYRATGGITDNIKRAATAQQLLVDSMILSKVSTLDQATALDTLAGGLLQIKAPLDSGQQLLDKWVAVSKRANVSIATLAESFAITASSAKGAGLSLDQLNGVIATVAENTTLSATEAGNAVRAFISGFQTDTAVRELSRFGVLVKTSGQESLDFMDVMWQVRDLFDEGLISQSQLNEIAEAIGGGARRGAQVVAFLKNLNRVTEVATVSELAMGDAQEALAIKMETLKTKSTELENAFIKLGQSLGTEGGLLDGAKIAIEVMTQMVNIVSKLTDTLGTAVPVMIAYAVAMGQINKVGGIAAFGNIASNALLGMRAGGGGGVAYQGDFAAFSKSMSESVKLDSIRNKTLTKMAGFLKSPAGMGRAIGGVGVGLQAVGSFASGDKWRGVGNVLGGAAALAFSSNPLMAIAGSAIGGAFMDYVYGQESEFKDLFAGLESPEDKPIEELSDLEKLQRKQQELTDSMVDAVHPIRLAWTNLFANAQAFIAPKRGQELTRVQAALVTLNRAGRDEELDNYYEQINKLTDAEKILSGEIIKGIPLYEKRNKLIIDNAPLIETLVQQYRDLAFEERLAGDITNKQFNEINKVLSSLGTSAGGYVAAFGEQFVALSNDVNTTAEAFEAIALALTHGNQADISYLLSLLTDIAEAEYAIADGQDVLANQDIISDRQVKGAKAISMILKDIQKNAFKLPTMVEMFGLSQKEAEEVIQRAKQIRDGLDEAIAGAGLGELHTEDEFKNIFGEIMLRVGQHGGTMLVEGLSEANIKEAMQELADEGKITLEETFGFMDFSDIGLDQFMELVDIANTYARKIDTASGGAVDLNWKTFAAITSDSITGPVTAELTLLQALMKELIDVSEDQVEGIYNLPSDGTFYVPFEGYAKGFGGGGAGGGIADLLAKWDMFISQFPKPEDVQDVFVTNMGDMEYTEESQRAFNEGELTSSLADYFGPMLGPPAPDPGMTLLPTDPRDRPLQDAYYNPPPFDVFKNLGDTYGGGGGVDFVEGFRGLWEKILSIFGKEPTIEELQEEGWTYGGAGGADIVESLVGLKSLEALVAYFTSGAFHDDAMKGAASPEESFTRIIEALQSLELFNLYDEGEDGGILDKLRDLFTGGGDGTQPTSYLNDSVSDLVTATQQLNETGQLQLALEINSDTRLTLDSQIISTVVKTFVYEEMLKREAASSASTTKTFQI